MREVAKKAIPILFNILFFFIPLVVFPKTSELFEFNKMVSTYILTVLIVSVWVVKMIYYKKVIFRRTILDVPLLLFVFSQVVSTIVSIDPTTSLFGYYSRVHGGLLSSLSYALLYWAYVSNMDKKAARRSVYFLIASGVLVSTYGVAQRFGIDKDIWVQDVVNRVFSSLGQPNWLATWIVAIMPLAWAMGLGRNKDKFKFGLWTAVSLVFFLVLLFTKSRSGLLGFILADVIFWTLAVKKNVKSLLVWHLSALALAASIGTIWTPSVGSLINNSPAPAVTPEPGGTESGDIRKIVWRGALDIWKKNPIMGTGVETFAYSYYSARPAEHNLTSEWEYLYNKAHNEYLNFAANSGTFGLASYLAVICFAIVLFKRNIQGGKNKLLNLGIVSGFSSILVTNFFGFSVAPVALVFFLLPGVSIAVSKEIEKAPVPKGSLLLAQKFGIFVVFILGSYSLFLISKYWYADFVYAKGKGLNDSAEPFLAETHLRAAIKANPLPALYYEELSAALASQAISWFESGDKQRANTLADESLELSSFAVELSPRDLSLIKARAALFIKLSQQNPGYLAEASRVFAEAAILAPTDAKIHYNLGLSLARLGKTEEAISVLNKTVELKSDYRDARFALALLLLEQGKAQDAKRQLRYILENINPVDPLVEQQLEEIP